jgi:hypothetical protein
MLLTSSEYKVDPQFPDNECWSVEECHIYSTRRPQKIQPGPNIAGQSSNEEETK